MAHDVRPSTLRRRSEQARRERRPAPDELVTRHLPDTVAYIDRQAELDAELHADPDTGEVPNPTRFYAWVPSESKPGTAYKVRYWFHPPTKQAPHGFVTAVHDMHGCEAHDNGKACWHLDCGLAAIVRDFHHLLPNNGRIGERSPLTRAGAPVPTDRVPRQAAVGFYD